MHNEPFRTSPYQKKCEGHPAGACRSRRGLQFIHAERSSKCSCSSSTGGSRTTGRSLPLRVLICSWRLRYASSPVLSVGLEATPGSVYVIAENCTTTLAMSRPASTQKSSSLTPGCQSISCPFPVILYVLRFAGGVSWGVTVVCLPSRVRVSAARTTPPGSTLMAGLLVPASSCASWRPAHGTCESGRSLPLWWRLWGVTDLAGRSLASRAGFECGSLLSCTPSTGTCGCYDCVCGWTEVPVST